MAQQKRTQLRHFMPGHHCSMQWLHNSILARLCSEYIYIYTHVDPIYIRYICMCIYIYIFIHIILKYIYIYVLCILYIYVLYMHTIYIYIHVYISMSVCLHLSPRPKFWMDAAGFEPREGGTGSRWKIICNQGAPKAVRHENHASCIQSPGNSFAQIQLQLAS